MDDDDDDDDGPACHRREGNKNVDSTVARWSERWTTGRSGSFKPWRETYLEGVPSALWSSNITFDFFSRWQVASNHFCNIFLSWLDLRGMLFPWSVFLNTGIGDSRVQSRLTSSATVQQAQLGSFYQCKDPSSLNVSDSTRIWRERVENSWIEASSFLF